MKSCRLPLSLLCLAICCWLSGCQRDEEIVHYQVARLETARPEPMKEAVRLLGAIVPHDDQLWFFKIVGPDAAVAALAEPFETLIKSVRFKDKGEPPIAWDLPAGWEQHPGVKQQRSGIVVETFATIKIKSEGEPLELAVSKAGGDVLGNVNRWRGQIGLRELSKEQLAAETKSVEVAGAKTTLVNVLGVRLGGAPRAARKAAEAGPKIQWKLPGGWTEVDPTVPFALRQLAVSKNTLVTISSVGGGLALNINRWRGQAKLPPLQADKLQAAMLQLKLAQGEASYVDIENTQNDKAPRILGVILPDEAGADWIIKMTGTREEVASEKANFEAFAKSLRFEKQ